MLSWALKRNSDGARDAPGHDDTQIEGPDTPAPVFAVRALKTALFGTPAPRASEQPRATGNVKAPPANDRSPVKPNGILLTPGTGTTRRKRVSFGHDVKKGAAAVQPTSTSGLPDECPGKFPSPWVAKGEELPPPRAKTRLTETMENSRTNKPRSAGSDAKDFGGAVKDTEDAWEEFDDESDRDGDVTVDLNEPHSRSGKYWKSYFETYHADAKAEMEKLVKYKQLAKSYAKKKDAEALDLNEKLKQEQERVKLMENKVAELGRQVALKTKKGAAESDTNLMMEELTKQTALALDYRKQVEELESLLHVGDEEREDKEPRQRRIASPRTHKALVETQRELRKARSQARELDKLREERDRLKSKLKFAEQRASKLVEENRKLSGDLSQDASKIKDLEKKLEESRGEALSKDRELKRFRSDYDKLKEDAKARYTEANQVLQKKNATISELQDEIATLRTGAAGSRWTARAKNLEAKLKTGPEKLKSENRESALKFLQNAEEESTQLLNELNDLRQASVEKGLLAPTSSARRTTATKQQRARASTDSYKRNSYNDDEALVSSRTFREKIEAEMGCKRNSAVLSERGNLQDSRSSVSSGVSAHVPRQEEAALSHPVSVRTSSRTTTSARNHEVRGILEDSLDKEYATTRVSGKSAPIEQPSKRSTAVTRSRPPVDNEERPQIDLVEDNFARLGGPETTTMTSTHNSAVWSVANTSRSVLPADRRAAAIARLQRKRVQREHREREQQQVGRDKENERPY
ncbi:spindle pole body formation-associated protein-domain-containing protein [Apodospora peruviana]|uniref:Spindle pole body formation-associated protein-domain-containing protein n=1 Tax=Apodospora peruviana TaxID=516989 RepID=A0AAE0IJB5_9PEZI|nr:spindle pole body formation-associated protein-domain-containing protein [Apodospora peruviana]